MSCCNVQPTPAPPAPPSSDTNHDIRSKIKIPEVHVDQSIALSTTQVPVPSPVKKSLLLHQHESRLEQRIVKPQWTYLKSILVGLVLISI